MNSAVYYDKKSFEKFSEEYFKLFLNEEVIPDYIPENVMGDENPVPRMAYSYSGSEIDGGTLIQAKESNYDNFVSGLIRLKYSADAESAIQANMIVALSEPKNSRATEFKTEWEVYQDYREECKSKAKLFFS